MLAVHSWCSKDYFCQNSHAEVVRLSCFFVTFNVRLEDLILDKMELPKNVRKKKETLCKDLEPVCHILYFLEFNPRKEGPKSNQHSRVISGFQGKVCGCFQK